MKAVLAPVLCIAQPDTLQVHAPETKRMVTCLLHKFLLLAHN